MYAIGWPGEAQSTPVLPLLETFCSFDSPPAFILPYIGSYDCQPVCTHFCLELDGKSASPRAFIFALD